MLRTKKTNNGAGFGSLSWLSFAMLRDRYNMRYAEKAISRIIS